MHPREKTLLLSVATANQKNFAKIVRRALLFVNSCLNLDWIIKNLVLIRWDFRTMDASERQIVAMSLINETILTPSAE
jgi:hypothetical protein